MKFNATDLILSGYKVEIYPNQCGMNCFILDAYTGEVLKIAYYLSHFGSVVNFLNAVANQDELKVSKSHEKSFNNEELW